MSQPLRSSIILLLLLVYGSGATLAQGALRAAVEPICEVLANGAAHAHDEHADDEHAHDEHDAHEHDAPTRRARP